CNSCQTCATCCEHKSACSTCNQHACCESCNPCCNKHKGILDRLCFWKGHTACECSTCCNSCSQSPCQTCANDVNTTPVENSVPRPVVVTTPTIAEPPVSQSQVVPASSTAAPAPVPLGADLSRSAKPSTEIKKAYEGRVGNALDYSWVTGQLFRI